jgi:hypothetical protein
MLLKIGALPMGAFFHYHMLLVKDECPVTIASGSTMRAVGQPAERTRVRSASRRSGPRAGRA